MMHRKPVILLGSLAALLVTSCAAYSPAHAQSRYTCDTSNYRSSGGFRSSYDYTCSNGTTGETDIFRSGSLSSYYDTTDYNQHGTTYGTGYSSPTSNFLDWRSNDGQTTCDGYRWSNGDVDWDCR